MTQDGHAVVALHLGDAQPHAVAGHGVEADRRLVEHEQRGAVDEGLRQLEAAHHAAGVGRGEPVLVAAEVDHLEHLVDSRARRSRRGTSKSRANHSTFWRPVRAPSIDSCWGT